MIIGNRPITNITNNNNTTIINNNQWNQYTTNNYARPWYAHHPTYYDRPWYGGRPAWAWSRPWYGVHYEWHHGYWGFWPSQPLQWFGTGLALGWLTGGGDPFVYRNPYYLAPTTIIVPSLNYAEPLPPPTPDQKVIAYPTPPDPTLLEKGDALPTTPPPAPTQDETVKMASGLFDEARTSFKQAEYAKAQLLVESAIAKLPSDGTLHEFRALTLFTQKSYTEAASTLYAVLAAGPGWDWDTMSALYGKVDDYRTQLRTLEEFVAKNPNDGAAHFVLAYHYLVLGSKDDAVKQLEATIKVQPDDKLAPALLKALTQPPPAK